MRLATPEFMTAAFLIHCASDGFHRIRPLRIAGKWNRKANIAKGPARYWGRTDQTEIPQPQEIIPTYVREPCPDCGWTNAHQSETFRRGAKRHRTRAPPDKARK